MEQLDHARALHYGSLVERPRSFARWAGWPLALALAVGCATAPKSSGPPPTRPEERSTLDTLLRHRSELGLDEEQVTRLEELETARLAQVAPYADALREAQSKRNHPPVGEKQRIPSVILASPSSPLDASHGRTASMVGPTGLRPGMNRVERKPTADEEIDRILQKFDESDSRAYADAMSQVLRERQRPIAEKLASDYRLRLYDYREACRRQETPAQP
jgi:hypothetical protein